MTNADQLQRNEAVAIGHVQVRAGQTPLGGLGYVLELAGEQLELGVGGDRELAPLMITRLLEEVLAGTRTAAQIRAIGDTHNRPWIKNLFGWVADRYDHMRKGAPDSA